jgi:hypothetical protein
MQKPLQGRPSLALFSQPEGPWVKAMTRRGLRLDGVIAATVVGPVSMANSDRAARYCSRRTCRTTSASPCRAMSPALGLPDAKAVHRALDAANATIKLGKPLSRWTIDAPQGGRDCGPDQPFDTAFDLVDRSRQF